MSSDYSAVMFSSTQGLPHPMRTMQLAKLNEKHLNWQVTPLNYQHAFELTPG